MNLRVVKSYLCWGLTLSIFSHQTVMTGFDVLRSVHKTTYKCTQMTLSISVIMAPILNPLKLLSQQSHLHWMRVRFTQFKRYTHLIAWLSCQCQVEWRYDVTNDNWAWMVLKKMAAPCWDMLQHCNFTLFNPRHRICCQPNEAGQIKWQLRRSTYN